MRGIGDVTGGSRPMPPSHCSDIHTVPKPDSAFCSEERKRGVLVPYGIWGGGRVGGTGNTEVK